MITNLIIVFKSSSFLLISEYIRKKPWNKVKLRVQLFIMLNID